MCEALLSLPTAQMGLKRSQAGDPSHPQNRSTKPHSGCPMQPQPFAAAPACSGGSSNLHVHLADLSTARGQLETVRDFFSVIQLYRTAHRLSKLSSTWA